MNDNRKKQIDYYWKDKVAIKYKKKFSHLWNIIPKDVKTILDVGGGIGGFYYTIPDQTKYKYLLVDVSGEAIMKAKENNIESLQFDIDNKPLPFADNSFDLIIACDILEHLNNPWAVLAEMTRVTKKYIIIYGPNFAYWKCRLDLLRGNPIRQMSVDKYGAIVNQDGLHIDHIYFITYNNIIYWARKLGLEAIKSQAFWYRRYFLIQWLIEPFFKNWGEVYRVLFKKINNHNKIEDSNFKF